MPQKVKIRTGLKLSTASRGNREAACRALAMPVQKHLDRRSRPHGSKKVTKCKSQVTREKLESK
jgi:hypothetical protein